MHTQLCTYCFNKEQLGYSTRQLSAQALAKKDICSLWLQILRRWKPGCRSLYWRYLGYRSFWSSGTVENTTCQFRSGWQNFPTLWATDLNNHMNQSHGNVWPTKLWVWRESFRAASWPKRTASQVLPLLSWKVDLGRMSHGSQDNHDQVLCQQHMTAFVYVSPSQGLARPAALNSAWDHCSQADHSTAHYLILPAIPKHNVEKVVERIGRWARPRSSLPWSFWPSCMPQQLCFSTQGVLCDFHNSVQVWKKCLMPFFFFPPGWVLKLPFRLWWWWLVCSVFQVPV